MDDNTTSSNQSDEIDKTDLEVTLDEVDQGILFFLQRDARNITIQEIADEVEVSPSTVRNRINKLENTDIIKNYAPQINYELAGFPLKIVFICSADADTRSQVARDTLDVKGVTQINELVTGERNLHIEVVATSTRDLALITGQLNERGLTVHSSEIITNTYTQPWDHFKSE